MSFGNDAYLDTIFRLRDIAQDEGHANRNIPPDDWVPADPDPIAQGQTINQCRFRCGNLITITDRFGICRECVQNEGELSKR